MPCTVNQFHGLHFGCFHKIPCSPLQGPSHLFPKTPDLERAGVVPHVSSQAAPCAPWDALLACEVAWGRMPPPLLPIPSTATSTPVPVFGSSYSGGCKPLLCLSVDALSLWLPPCCVLLKGRENVSCPTWATNFTLRQATILVACVREFQKA